MLSAALVLMVATSLATGCGGKEEEQEFEDPASEWEATHFAVIPDAHPFYGPTPFTTKFTTEVKNAKGKVRWEWDFNDGSKSDEAEPTHTFTKPGLYTVGVAGTDESGERDGGAVIVRAMTEEEVAKLRAGKVAAGIDPDTK